MSRATLPNEREMYQALLDRDASFEGIFFVGVKTTGIFCRPTCPARKPRFENVRWFATAAEAAGQGFRPCRRCRPLEARGATPDWLRDFLRGLEEDPARRWSDAELREAGVDPVRLRRWFKQHHGVTFQAWQRARRLGTALGRIQQGEPLLQASFAAGFESDSGFRDAFQKLFDTTPGQARAGRTMAVTRILTPLGPAVAAAVDEGVCLLEFADRRMLETQFLRVGKRLDARPVPGEHEHLDRLGRELEEYFDGRRRVFEVPLAIAGTPFQEAVWKELLRIPCGRTRSYDALGSRIGRPGAQRAVGKANGDNPIAIVVPCHRVVRADGSLCGYGGGLWRKRYLLELEGGLRPAELPLAAS